MDYCSFQTLDGQNIYNGCCSLRIDYSNLSNLNVKYNNEKSFDFTKTDQLGAGGDAMHMQRGGGMLGGKFCDFVSRDTEVLENMYTCVWAINCHCRRLRYKEVRFEIYSLLKMI